MPVKILIKSSDEIQFKKAYAVQKTIGLILISLAILIFVIFMLLHPERMGKSYSLKTFSFALMLFSVLFLVREFYFIYIDRDVIISKNLEDFRINDKVFGISDIESISIIEYVGIGIMENGFNVFIKLKNRKKIPISIRIGQTDMESVRGVLVKFIGIQKVEEKKWWIG